MCVSVIQVFNNLFRLFISVKKKCDWLDHLTCVGMGWDGLVNISRKKVKYNNLPNQ